MRQERTVQATIFEVFAQHEIGCELKAISQWLDGQLPLVSLVAGDLRRRGVRETGRRGLPAETVLRLRCSRAATAELRGVGLSPRRFGVVSRLCSPASEVVTEEIDAAPDDQRDLCVDLGGG